MRRLILIGLILGLLSTPGLQAQSGFGREDDGRVISIHSTDQSENINSVKQTADENNYILPFIEYFDNGTFPPTDWITFIGTNGAGTSYNWAATSNGYENNGAMVRWENAGGTVLEDWLVSPLITLGTNSTLSYFEKQDYGTEYWSDYTIRISTNSQNTHGDFTTIASYGESDFSTSYSQREIDLSAYDGQSVYIAFVMTNDDGDSWYIDNVLVEEANVNTGGKLLISEVAYPMSEPEGRFVELYNSGNVAIDLTRYYLGFYKNTQRINLSGTVNPGEKFVYAPKASDFQNTYGFAADQANGGINASWFDGTDAVILLYKKNNGKYRRNDTYGVAKTDGTGTDWEYINKHAVRKTNITEDRYNYRPEEWEISTAYASTYFDVTPGNHNEYYYWNGNNSSNWDDYQNWTVSGGSSFIPDAGANVIIPSGSTTSPVQSYDRFPYFFNSLTIQPGASFTVGSDNILKVVHDVTVASGATLDLKSDASGAATFIPVGAVSGDANVERYMATISGTTGNGIWHLFSSPISNLQTSSLMDQYLKYWVEPNANWTYISSTSETLVPGNGYALLLLSGYGNTVNITGNLNTGDILSPNLEFTSGTAWEGYNLIGNPYTASIDWDVIQPTLPAGVDQAIYYWDVANSQYIFYNNGSGTASRYIPSGQAFFIHVTADNQQLTFTEDSRVADNYNIYYKSKSGKTYTEYTPSPKEVKNELVIETSTSFGKTDKIFLKFHEKGTTGFDGEFDAIKFYSNNEEIADAWLTYKNTEYSINTLPLEMMDGRYDMTVRFGKQASYSLNIDGIESFSEDQPINLYDRTTKRYYDLRKYKKLNFYNTAGVEENRFQIVFSDGVGTEEIIAKNNWLIFSSDGRLNIQNVLSNSNITFDYQVFTVDGKLVTSGNKKTELRNKYLPVNAGIYIIKLITEEQQITKKLWLSR